MKFSLIGLLTFTSFAAWLLALSQMSRHQLGLFVPLSFLFLIAAMFVVAMVTPKDSEGNLDYENSTLLKTLEPTLKLALLTVVLAIIGVIVKVFYSGF